jgi:glycosyltransferase involved in cell wall biosynthesis
VKLSIVIPLYNEEKTVKELLERVVAVEIPGTTKEIILTDDCSTDRSARQVREFRQEHPEVEMRVYTHERNRGKGAAVRTCFSKVAGDIVIIQDADLEVEPREYPKLLKPILDGRADVVYGSRFLGKSRRDFFFRNYAGNKMLTIISNLLNNISITDMETCYKVFRSSVIRSFVIRSNRFGIEPEITAKIAKRGCRIHEVPISYRGRTYHEGKKIGWKDGLSACWTMVKYRLME